MWPDARYQCTVQYSNTHTTARRDRQSSPPAPAGGGVLGARDKVPFGRVCADCADCAPALFEIASPGRWQSLCAPRDRSDIVRTREATLGPVSLSSPPQLAVDCAGVVLTYRKGSVSRPTHYMRCVLRTLHHVSGYFGPSTRRAGVRYVEAADGNYVRSLQKQIPKSWEDKWLSREENCSHTAFIAQAPATRRFLVGERKKPCHARTPLSSHDCRV